MLAMIRQLAGCERDVPTRAGGPRNGPGVANAAAGRRGAGVGIAWTGVPLSRVPVSDLRTETM